MLINNELIHNEFIPEPISLLAVVFRLIKNAERIPKITEKPIEKYLNLRSLMFH